MTVWYRHVWLPVLCWELYLVNTLAVEVMVTRQQLADEITILILSQADAATLFVFAARQRAGAQKNSSLALTGLTP